MWLICKTRLSNQLFQAVPLVVILAAAVFDIKKTYTLIDEPTQKVLHFWSRVGISKAICANFVKGYNFSAPPFPFSAETQLLLHQKRDGNANTKADNI